MKLGRLVATVALVLIASAAFAEVKWDQYPDPAGNAWMSQLDTYVSNGWTAEMADDFLCGDGFPITAVEWWGTTVGMGSLPDHYLIRFYSDIPAGTGGIEWSRPGDLLYQEECWDFSAVWDPGLDQFHFFQELAVPFCQELGTIYWFSVVGVVCSNDGEGAGWCDCYTVPQWNDEAVIRSDFYGYPEWTATSEYASGYFGPRELSFVLHGLSGNVICDPDPLDFLVGSPTPGTIDVKYLGCGSGLVAGYSVKFSWVPGVATTSLGDVTEGTLLSSAGSTQFMKYVSGTNEITVDCALLSGVEGVSGPGTMFTIDFDAAAYGTCAVDVTLISFRDKDNSPLSGFYEDDGEIRVDITNPSVTGVSLANLTLGHTDEYAKDGDNLKLTATVTDDYSLTKSDITADLSTLLDGVTIVEAESYNSGTGLATWTTWANVSLTADGLKTVTVTAKDGLGNEGTGSDQITVDNTAPAEVTGVVAAPGHNKVALTWVDAASGDDNPYRVEIQSRKWADYPTYDDTTPVYPDGPGAGDDVWEGTGASRTVTYLGDASERSIYYFSIIASDMALNYSSVDSDGQDRATNYWLGDVVDHAGGLPPNGFVYDYDIVALGGTYGVGTGHPSFDDECDVGPTDDHSRIGIPEPDNSVSFEDLMIFAMNYDVVGPAKVVPFLGEPGVGDLALALVENGRTNGGVLELALRLEGNLGDVKGFTAELEFEGLEFLSARLSDEMSSPLADMFFWSEAASRSVQVDAAVLGTDVTIGGSGDVVLFSFQVLDETYAVDFTSAKLRGVANEDLTAELEGLSSDGVPVAFKLVQNAPNPFNPVTKVAYHVPSASRVTIRVFDVTGRLVTTLVDGVVEPGRHQAVWNGTNDRGESVGSGVYFCTMETPDFRDSQKMTLLK